MPAINIKIADEFALNYDKSISNNKWNGPKILFDEIDEFIIPKSRILDLGIGTGESSKRFKSIGCNITGIDGSVKMLEECKKKNIGEKLILHNLENSPFPLEKDSFDIVISNGVFHLIKPLKPIFSEIKRILKSNGFFTFTFENTDNILNYSEIEPGIWKMKTKQGVLTFKYSEKYIHKLLIQNNFEIIKQKRFLGFTNLELQKEFYFTLIVAKLK